MIYQLTSGEKIDTSRDLDFEERNFIQKMMIYSHLKVGLDEFRARWRKDGVPVWKGPATLNHPSPAVKILLDLEQKMSRG
ncbi:MAG: hypothetical protein V1816_21730 [Pseudomonadota bacterium]